MKRLSSSIFICTCFVLSILVLCGRDAKATENGVSSGATGAEDFMAGAVPPPGFYYMNYFSYYSANTLKGNKGNNITPFNVSATVDINRFVYITDLKILGADYGTQILIPLVNLDLKTPGGAQGRAGLADIVFTPILLSWHSKNWHAAAAVDTFLPTGDYGKKRVANIGRNYFTTELAAAFTYLSDSGLEFSGKLMYDINFKNDTTNYTSGNEFHFDSLLGIHLDKWKFGLNTYYYKQVTNDIQNGKVYEDGNKGQVFAAGPAIGYEYKNINFALKYQREMLSENKSEGDRFWFKVAIPF